MRPVEGRIVRELVKERCQPYREQFAGKRIWIVRFLPPTGEKEPLVLMRHEAAKYSAEAKEKSFEAVGCLVTNLDLPYNLGLGDFVELLGRASAAPDTVGIIVQNPVPVLLQEATRLLPPHLDLDGLQPDHPLFRTSATAEAIARLVEEFAEPGHTVAVVGGRGFVGSGVMRLLEQRGIGCFGLDAGADLLRTRMADMVVSATGVPGLLDERHITGQHVLVVDAGFAPMGKTISGDIARSARGIPRYLTPVPGGVGPLQMATLLERLLQAQGIAVEQWSYRSALEEERHRQLDRKSERQAGGPEL